MGTITRSYELKSGLSKEKYVMCTLYASMSSRVNKDLVQCRLGGPKLGSTHIHKLSLGCLKGWATN